MKEQDEFLKQMENLQVPDISPEHPEKVKMAIMNADRSAALGVWLIVVPSYFLLCVFMYYFFHIHTGWFGSMFKMMEGLERTPYIDFLGPIILVVLPIICIIINALAITHVQVKKQNPAQSGGREFSIQRVNLSPSGVRSVCIFASTCVAGLPPMVEVWT